MIGRLGAYRVAGISGLLVIALALVFGGGAAQGADGPVVTQAPTISGTPRVGSKLTASNWRINPSNASYVLLWFRCTDNGTNNCGNPIDNANAATYTLVPADLNRYMRVVVYTQSGSYKASNPLGPVQPTATPTPTPTPTPAPTATPVPTPVPTPVATATPVPTPPPFDVAAPASTPVPTSGAVLQQNATSKKAKMLKPRPTVRIRGTLTPTGAHVSSLTVRASKGMTVSATCSGSGCPTRRMTRSARATTHLTKFERSLRSGIRLIVKVSKPGYVSKITVLTIRRGAAPSRTDSCLYPGHRRTQKCQS